MAVPNNTVVLDNGLLMLNNNDHVAALQFTIVGARESDIVRGTGLPKGFSISAHNVPGGVKIIVCSFDGQYLPQGSHALLKGLPAGSAVTDVRMADPEANYLNTVIETVTTGISGTPWDILCGKIFGNHTPSRSMWWRKPARSRWYQVRGR